MTQLPEGFEKVEKNQQIEPPTSFKELPEGFEKVGKITELPEDFVKEDDLSVDEIKKMQSEGVSLSDKLQRKLFKAEDERSFLDKVSGAAGAFIPAAADIIGQTASGAVELANKAVVQPAALALTGGYNRLDSEEAKKVFKEREETIRSLGVGAAKDIEETVNAAVRFGMFGSATTDKLLGKSDEERFRAWQNRQTMRQLEAQEVEQNPDRVAALLSQNPLIQGYVEYEAKKMGLSSEEVEKVKQDYIQTMLDQGLTKDQINEQVATLGEFVSPVAIPGGGRLSGAVLKPLSKVTAPVFNKATDLTARGISKVAGGTEFAANKVLQGTELLQTGARKIGEYAINDPDTWIKGTVNTAIMPVVGVAKPVSATARVIKDITKQVDVGGTAGRRGMFERAGQAVESSDLTKKLFGAQGKGGVTRAKLADWTIRQSNALIQPGINAAALNVAMGLPDIETAEDLGFVSGTGFGIGSMAGTRSFERVGGLIDPRTTMAEKISNLVTPDPAAYRRDEDADIKRFMAQASPEIQKNITDVANIERRKAAVDATIANLEKSRDAQIDPEDVAFKQKQIDGFLKQKEALAKTTPETQAEALRQTQLAFIDAYDLAQSTGGVAGLRGVNIAVLDPNNADQFFRDLYGDSLRQAEATVNLLTGIPSLTETDSQKLTESRQLLQKFQNDVEGAKSARGFAIQEDNTDPNSTEFVPPHLRRINQQGATAVINADLIKHLSDQGFNIRHTLQHEVQHAVQQFGEVNKMLAPLRGQLFDQKIKNDDGTTEVYQQGIYSDEDLNRYAARYANLMSPNDNGASFYAQFGGDSEKMRAYIKDEILAETAAATGEYAGGTRASLDDVGRNVMDWLEVKTKSGRLKQLKEALRRNGVIFDNIGAVSSVLDARMSPETLAMMRQYQRGLKDFDGTMTIQQSRESDEPDIPLTKVLGSIALQNKYRHADFFEKEQIIKATAPDGSVTEIVVPAGAKIDPFVDVYRTQGGQLVDADGNVVTLGPEITFGSMPDGTTFEVDTRIARKSNGSPIILTNREMKARARKRTEIIQTAIDSAKDDGSGVRLSDTGNGNYRGVMSPAQIEAFMAMPNEVVSPNLKRMTKFFNQLMARNDGTRVVMEYQAALLNGKYKALSPKIRDEVPIGFQLTKDGNFALTTISVSRLYDKMQAWADKKPTNLQPWNGDTGAFWDSVVKYLDNHARGEKGETGLHPDAYIAGKMKNKINDLFNAYNAETKQSNPERSTLPRARGKDNLDIVIRSRRLDRINNFEESPSQKLPINYGYLTTNYMPAVNPMAAPMTAEEVQNRFDGSVTATRVRQAMATGEINALESELRQMDDLLPTESLQLVQVEGGMPKIQIVSMFDPENIASLEPEEIVSDIEAETEAELAILDAQDGTVPPQDIAKVLSAKLDQLYADGGRSPIIPALENELGKINQQLELQAQEQAASTIQVEEVTQAPRSGGISARFMPERMEGEAPTQQKLQFMPERPVDQVAAEQGFNVKAYHGTSRADRVGNRFRKTRATSGPMAFFTSDPNIAENYSKGKADTSIEPPKDYRDWFKFKPAGSKKEVNISDAWYSLTPEQRKNTTEKLYTTGYENADEGTGAIIPNAEFSIAGKDSIDYELRKARGNALEAAKELWLTSGTLFNDEVKFTEVLKSLGVDARFDDPFAKNPKVYDVFLKIQNPLVTSEIPENVMEALRANAKKQRKPSRQFGADAWDKRIVNAKDWIAELDADYAAGKNSFAWTRIPDWVTETLKTFGYDSIQDTGGKMGGEGHDVYIPFEENQIKSAAQETFTDAGKKIPMEKRFFEKPDIRFMPERPAERFPTPERGFYSGLQQTIDQKVQGKFASPDQIKAIVSNPQNVKAEELKWSGVLGEIDRLAAENQGKVPKDKVMEYLRNEGAVKFEEVTLGESRKKESYDQISQRMFGIPFSETTRDQGLQIENERMFAGEKRVADSAKYAQYQLPGGKNYREVVMAMPEKDRGIAESDIEDQAKVDAGRQWESWTPQERSQAMDEVRSRFNRAGEYTSSHFPEISNYVAHMRLNERTDAEGNDGLFMEELQSDRHQAGREKGYREEASAADVTALDVAEKARSEAHARYRDALKADRPESELTPLEEEWYRAKAIASSLQSKIQQAKEGIPDAPFRKDWSLQLFKRALRDAVESGKEWIGWTVGETQAERYDLSKQLSQVEWYPDTNEVFGYDKNGEKVINTIANEQALPDVVGKELAQKLIDSDPYQEGQKILKGLDLKVGGEGMKGFYDQILPKEIGKYVAKMGGKVEKSEIETPKGKPTDYEDFNAYNKAPESKQTPIWKVNITPEMANIVSAGQLQFMPERSAEQEPTIGEKTEIYPKIGRPTISEKPQSSEMIGADTIKPVDLQTSAKPEADAVIKPFSNALVSSAGLINFLPAYHGTPFDVDKFKLANIGTGEGAQAYGWGLYFAQARKVAEEYARVLANRDLTGYKNAQLNAKDIVSRLGGNAEYAAEILRDQLQSIPENSLNFTRISDTLKMIETGEYAKDLEAQGNLYKVDIDVKDEDLLDWDKPLSEQSEKVQKVLAEMNDDYRSDSDEYDSNEQGQITYSRLGNPQEASKALLAAGISGIRYLDGTSRLNPKTLEEAKARVKIAERDVQFSPSNEVLKKILKDEQERLKTLEKEQQKNTYNYVVFDENLITILDKNDKPVAGELPKQVDKKQENE